MKDYLKIAVIAILFLFTGCQKQEFPVQDAIKQITTEYGYSKFELDFELQEWQKSKWPEKRRCHREAFRKEIRQNSFAYEVILLEYDDIDDLGYITSYFVTFGGTDGAGFDLHKLSKDSPNEFIVLTDFEFTKLNETIGMKPFRDERFYEKVGSVDAIWFWRLGKRVYRTYKLTLELGKQPVLELLDYYKHK